MVKQIHVFKDFGRYYHGQANKGRQMVDSELTRTMDELKEFYKWLLCRAREEEDRGRESSGQVYLEFAETVKKGLAPIECTRKSKGHKRAGPH